VGRRPPNPPPAAAGRRMTQLAGHDELLARTTALFTEGLRPPAIARTLAAEGWLMPHGRPVTEGSVRSWLQRRGLLPDGRHRPTLVVERAPDEFTVAELSVWVSPRARSTGGCTKGWSQRVGRRR